MPSIERIRTRKHALTGPYTRSDDRQGLGQVLTTLLPLALLWALAIAASRISWWLTAACLPLLSLFCLRVFALLHECGHNSLFRSAPLNRMFGFLLGVLSGMPQYVWSQNHAYHHAHNGNWEKYRGPYTTLSTDEYAALDRRHQYLYRRKCSITTAPLAGFIYLIFNPRWTWLKGSLQHLAHIARGKCAQPDSSLSSLAGSFHTRYWKSRREYWHMFWNNVVLLSTWVLMCRTFGTGVFFFIYLLSLSAAGAAGIILFTVQHNFEHSYASDTARWDSTRGAIKGTSFLVLPPWLNWFTANIGYHHIHHLSSGIPSYRLVACHEEQQEAFADVTRVPLSGVYGALKCILWDTRAQRIISVAEYGRVSVDAGGVPGEPSSHSDFDRGAL